MRLIDVDVYCATICRCNRRECDKAKCPIHNAPTAYDIDKVVEELEELKTIKGSMKTVTCRKWDYGTVNKAIEIVKHDCVADDVCEWKQTSTARYKTGCGYKVEEYFDTNARYCKQCGKKIKVV